MSIFITDYSILFFFIIVSSDWKMISEDEIHSLEIKLVLKFLLIFKIKKKRLDRICNIFYNL